MSNESKKTGNTLTDRSVASRRFFRAPVGAPFGRLATQRRSFVAGLAATGLLLPIAAPTFAQGDPLPSWNDGPVKQAILDFVTKTTMMGGPDYVPVPERIATF